MARVEDFYPLHPDTQKVIDKCNAEIPDYEQEYLNTLLDPQIIYKPGKAIFTGMIKYINANYLKPNNIDVYNIFICDALFKIYTSMCYKYTKIPSMLNFSLFVDINTDTFNTWKTGERKSKLYWELNSAYRYNKDIYNSIINNRDTKDIDKLYIDKIDMYNTNIYNTNNTKSNTKDSDNNSNSYGIVYKLISNVSDWRHNHPGERYREEPSSLAADCYKKWLKECESATLDSIQEVNSVGNIFVAKACYGYVEQPQRIEITTSTAAPDMNALIEQYKSYKGLADKNPPPNTR